MINYKNIAIVVLSCIIIFGGLTWFYFNKEQQAQTLENERMQKVFSDSVKTVLLQDSLRKVSQIIDSIESEKIILQGRIDSASEIIAGNSFLYSDIYSIDNIHTLKSRLLNLENLENWQRVSPKSRKLIHVDYEDDIENLLFFAITGSDKIKGFKNLINQTSINLAENVLLKERRVRAIAELFNQSNFFDGIEVLDTKTNADRTINIYLTDKKNAKWWEKNAVFQSPPFLKFESQSQFKVPLARRKIPRGRFTICIENTSDRSPVDFAIQILGVKSKVKPNKLDEFLSTDSVNENIVKSDNNLAKQPSGQERLVPKTQPVALFNCKTYNSWVGEYFGVQLYSSSDCEDATQKRDLFKELTSELAYVIKSKKDKRFKVIYGRFLEPDSADECVYEINKKLPQFMGCFKTRYPEHLERNN